MKRNKKQIIIICVVALFVFQAVCLTGYFMLKKRIELGDYRYFCEEIQVDLQEDELFESQYGEVVSVTLDETRKYKRLSGSTRLVPCVVETERATYLVWVEFDTSTFSSVVQYESITDMPKG